MRLGAISVVGGGRRRMVANRDSFTGIRTSGAGADLLRDDSVYGARTR